MQDVATNYISGVLLVLQRPFTKGSTLRVHIGSLALEGEVQSINLRYIVLRDKQKGSILIPSSMVYASPVVVMRGHFNA